MKLLPARSGSLTSWRLFRGLVSFLLGGYFFFFAAFLPFFLAAFLAFFAIRFTSFVESQRRVYVEPCQLQMITSGTKGRFATTLIILNVLSRLA
jgi:hypothetical protein